LHLGGITERATTIIGQRRCYWHGVHEHLDRLGLTIDDRHRIEAAIALKVPPLSRE
jgi:uncharacterized lipoprotein